MIKKGKIGVLMGGCSSEREISLKSGKAVLKAFQNAGLEVSPVDIRSTREDDVIRLLREEKIDLAFICMHGAFGEDGELQAILEKHSFPFTGSGAEASRIAMDKLLAHNALERHGIRVPFYRSYSRSTRPSPDQIWNELGCRALVVKPSAEGSSFGVSIVASIDEMAPALESAFHYGEKIMVEQYIPGRELTVGILGERALPVVEICPKKVFFDFSAKYQKGETEYIVPARIPDSVASRLQQISVSVFKVIGSRDFARIDFRLSPEEEPFFLELNSIPGFTETSLLPMAAANAGIDFESLCLKIAGFGFERMDSGVHTVNGRTIAHGAN